MYASYTKEQISNHIPAGTRLTGRYGKRRGIASALDQDIINSQLMHEKMAYGDGKYSFKLMAYNSRGEPIEDTSGRPLALGDDSEAVYPDKNGIYTVFDSSYLNIQYKKHKEQQERISDVCEMCSVSNDQAKFILGKDIFETLYPGVQPDNVPDNDPMIQANGTPEYLAVVSKESQAYALGYSKLRRCVLNAGIPLVKKETPANVQNYD